MAQEMISTAKLGTSGNDVGEEQRALNHDHEEIRMDLFHTLHDAGLKSTSTQSRDQVVAAILREFDERDGMLAGDAYVVWHTVSLCNIDVNDLLQDPFLAAAWERVRSAALVSEERMDSKRKRMHEEMVTGKSTDEGMNKRRDYEPDIWRSFFAAASIIGMDKMVHYGWTPRPGSSAGRAFLFDVQRAVREAASWTVFARRICAIQWVMCQDGVPFRPSKFSNGTCLLQQSHLKAFQRWEGGKYRRGKFEARDVDLTQAQIDEMGCEKDYHGLLRYKLKVHTPVSSEETAKTKFKPNDVQVETGFGRSKAAEQLRMEKDKTTDAKKGRGAARRARKAAVETAMESASAAAHVRNQDKASKGRQRHKNKKSKKMTNLESRSHRGTILQDSEDAEDPLGDLDDLLVQLGDDNEVASADDDEGRGAENQSTRHEEVDPASANGEPSSAVPLLTARPTSDETANGTEGFLSSDGDHGCRQNFLMPSLAELQGDFEGSRQRILAALRKLQTLGKPGGGGGNDAHYGVAIDWMERVRLPHVGDLNALLHGVPAVDVVELSSAELMQLLDDGHTIDMPIILREQLHKLSGKDVVPYVQDMKRCREWVEVQRSGAALTEEIKAEDGLGTIEDEVAEPSTYIANSAPMNLLNLRDLAQAQKPVVFEHPRWRLMQMLDRVATNDPGKQMTHQPSDIISCEAFNLLASTGSFSRPHVDYVGGTWVRVLSPASLKLWNMAVHMTEADRREFERKGASYVPSEGKAVAVPLQQGDLLIMPPGLSPVHAPLTLTPCLMDGGMFWDQHRIIKILKNMCSAALNPDTTNEPTPQQLPTTLASLRTIVMQDYDSYRGESGDVFQDEFWAVLGDFREKVACSCNPRTGKGCNTAKCTCHRRGSRCTGLCGRHAKVKLCCKMEDHKDYDQDEEGATE